MFHCARTNVRLTPAGCGRLFRSVMENRPHAWEGRHACLGCNIGRVNAGGNAATEAQLAGEVWKDVCDRCLTSGARLVGGRFCVSCYNRDREARIGKDRKGHRPVLCDAIHNTSISVFRDRQVEFLLGERVTGAYEAMVAAAKVTTTPLTFGWSAHRVG